MKIHFIPGALILFALPYILWGFSSKALKKEVKVPVLIANQHPGYAIIKGGLRAQTTALAFRPDNLQLVSGGYGEIVLWDPLTPKLQQRICLKEIKGHVRSLYFINNHTLLLGGGTPGLSGFCHILNLTTQSVELSFPVGDDVVTKVTASPDNKTVVAGDAQGRLFIYNRLNQQERPKPEPLQGEITGLEFRKNSSQLGACSLAGNFLVWDQATNSRIFWTNTNTHIQGFRFIRNGNNALLATEEEEFNGGRLIKIVPTNVKIRKRNTKEAKGTFGLNHSSPMDIEINKKGNLLCFPCKDGSLSIIPYYHPINQRSFQEHNDWVTAISISNNESLLATGDASGVIKLWSIPKRKLLVTLVQQSNSSDKWLAITPGGYYWGTFPEAVSWQLPQSTPSNQIKQLFNRQKVKQLIVPAGNKKQKAKGKDEHNKTSQTL